MDLEKVSNKEKLVLCQKYFYGGICLLPFLWIINAVWFFKYAFLKPEFPEQKKMKKLVVYSFIGGSIWTVLFISWIIVFQFNRIGWSEIGDKLSFVVPKGMA